VVELTDRLLEELRGGKYRFVVMNIANPDMVGHTGIMPAAVSAVEATDAALGRIMSVVEEKKGVMVLTADHGNCEIMFDPATGQAHTAHTTSPVPLAVFDPEHRWSGMESGGALENVAPTILEIFGIAKPEEMTAQSLLRP
ncbi:MAG: alkaline phosphatase family protein, partial [Thermoanaerobaculia bacterium]